LQQRPPLLQQQQAAAAADSVLLHITKNKKTTAHVPTCAVPCFAMPPSVCLQRPLTVQGAIAMNLRGRIVPNTGGLEIPVDCNLLYNVSHALDAAAVRTRL
jgi:hypothetical protein